MILQGDNPLGDIAALAATVYGNVQNSKREKYANEEQSKRDADNSAIVQAQLQRAQLENQTQVNATEQATRAAAFWAGQHLPKDYSKMSPEDQAAYWQSVSLQAKGMNDDPGATYAQHMAESIPRGYQQIGSGNLDAARVKWTNAQTNNAIRLFDHQMQMQRVRASAQEIRAGHRAIAARGSDPSGRAYQQALSAINDGTVRAAVQSSIDQYQDAQKAYAAAGDDSQPPPQYQQPQFTVNVTTGPNGQPMPLVQMKPPGGGGRPQAAQPQPQQQGGGIGGAIGGAVKGVENFFGNMLHGGGGQPQAAPPQGGQRLTALTKDKKPIHSTDGGKTWLPGP